MQAGTTFINFAFKFSLLHTLIYMYIYIYIYIYIYVSVYRKESLNAKFINMVHQSHSIAIRPAVTHDIKLFYLVGQYHQFIFS